MRKSFLLTIAFAAACLLFCAQETRAQYAYGASGIGYDPNTKIVYGYSRTAVDYWAGAYYDPYVEGYLFDPYQLRDWGYSRGYEDLYDAYVETASYTTPSTRYDVISDHYVISWYSVSVTICDYYGFYGGCGYDPYGFGNFFGGTGGGYGYFFGPGYGGYVPERTYYLGTTGISGVTPSDCGGSSASLAPQGGPEGEAQMAPIDGGGGGDGGTGGGGGTYDYESSSETTRDYVELEGDFCTEPPWTARIYSTNNSEYLTSAQKAMLGASIPLKADASDGKTNSSYAWKVDNNDAGTSQTLNTHIDTLGSHTISVVIKRGTVSRTASVTVSVEVPELNSYTAGNPALVGDEWDASVRTGSGCIGGLFNPNWYLMLGCEQTVYGMEIDASIKTVPKVISTRSESKLKFVQIVNTYLKRVDSATGDCKVLTKRPSENDTNTGWMLDGSDPYGLGSPRPGMGNIDSENRDRGSTITIDDTPHLLLNTGYNWTLDDKFESYFVYYTGTEAAPQNEKAIGMISWGWGGKTTYTAADGSHHEVPGSLRPADRIEDVQGVKLTPTNDGTGIRQYDRATVQSFTKPENFKPCGGTTPPGGGTRNGMTFISQAVTTTMAAGGVYAVSVTVKNSGDTTWTPDLYKLGSQNPHDNATWGTNRIYLPAGVTVPPGSDYTFNFNVTAPATGGLYNFQWRMVKEGVEWFGDPTTNVTVNVSSPDPSCDLSMENSCYANGGDWNYATCSCSYYYDPCGGYYSNQPGETQMARPICY